MSRGTKPRTGCFHRRLLLLRLSDDNGKQEDGPILGHAESHPLQDVYKENRIVHGEGRELLQHQGLPSGEDDASDSDSDDNIRVTIGNIKTGAPSYMGTPMNLNLKTGRGYGAPASAKSQPKGIHLDAAGNVNGMPVIEADLEAFEDKPWRKPGGASKFLVELTFPIISTTDSVRKHGKLIVKNSAGFSSAWSPQPPSVRKIRSRFSKEEWEMQKKNRRTISSKWILRQILWPWKLGGTIDVISGQAGTIRRVEGRRRDKHASEENPIQVLGDHGNKSQPLQQPQQPSQTPQQQQPFAPPTGPPPPLSGPPPPHFLHPPPPPPVTSVPPPLHPPGLPPPGPIPDLKVPVVCSGDRMSRSGPGKHLERSYLVAPGLFPPPLAPPPALLIPTLNGQPAGYSNQQPPPFGYNSTDSGFISYPPISTSHTPWVTPVDKDSSMSDAGHWEYSGTRRERERDRDQTLTTSDYNNDDERYHYYSRERSYDFERDYRRSRDHSREREDRHRDRRHRDKEEGSKHKSSRRKQHESEEGESHRRHRHKKSKRSKEEKEVSGEGVPEGNGQDSKE